MSQSFELQSPLGRSYETDPGDVRRTKQALHGLGYYRIPAHGLTDYPDRSLFKGIEMFQRDYGLRRDGIIKPGGETEAVLNHVLSRHSVRGDPSKLNSERLFGLFDRFTAPEFHGDGGAESTRCCATGTCDNIS